MTWRRKKRRREEEEEEEEEGKEEEYSMYHNKVVYSSFDSCYRCHQVRHNLPGLSLLMKDDQLRHLEEKEKEERKKEKEREEGEEEELITT